MGIRTTNEPTRCWETPASMSSKPEDAAIKLPAAEETPDLTTTTTTATTVCGVGISSAPNRSTTPSWTLPTCSTVPVAEVMRSRCAADATAAAASRNSTTRPEESTWIQVTNRPDVPHRWCFCFCFCFFLLTFELALKGWAEAEF